MSISARQIVQRSLNFVSNRAVILLYHRIAELHQDPWGLAVQPKNFAEHLEVMREIATSLRDIEPCSLRPLSRRCSVAVTFDDGYSDNYRNALPLLEKFEIPATFFITTGYVGKSRPFWWDELQSIMLGANLSHSVRVQVGGNLITLLPANDELPLDALRRIHPLVQQLDAEERQEALHSLRDAVHVEQNDHSAGFAMIEEELQRLAVSPFAEIGAHTVTHPKLSALSPKRQFEEIEDSKTYLEALLGIKITSFSYPFGAAMHFTESTEHLVIASGFQRACTTEAAVFRERHSVYRIPRLYVPDVDGERFSRWLWSYLRN